MSEDATVTALREQLGVLVAARSRAESEARRLAGEEHPAIVELVSRYEHQAGVLTSEISILRVSLRGAEARAG
jgi:hypothetical protein